MDEDILRKYEILKPKKMESFLRKAYIDVAKIQVSRDKSKCLFVKYAREPYGPPTLLSKKEHPCDYIDDGK